jgi:hypothetical protein
LPRPRDAGSDALLNYGALELREHPAHLEQRIAGRGARIDALAI